MPTPYLEPPDDEPRDLEAMLKTMLNNSADDLPGVTADCSVERDERTGTLLVSARIHVLQDFLDPSELRLFTTKLRIFSETVEHKVHRCFPEWRTSDLLNE